MRNLKAETYRILYNLKGSQIEQWFKVSDITSSTHEEEKKRHVTHKKIKTPENSPLSPASTHKKDSKKIDENPNIPLLAAVDADCNETTSFRCSAT